MARVGVTYLDIATAAVQLISEGKQPTIETIRHILGTGSSTTISNHLRTWRERQQVSANTNLQENLPPEFVTLMQGLWQRLLNQAAEELSTVKQSNEERFATLNQQLEKYRHNNQRWQQMYQQWLKEKDELVNERNGLKQLLMGHQKEEVANKIKVDGLKQQLNTKQERIDELQILSQKTQTLLEQFHEQANEERRLSDAKHKEQLQIMSDDLTTLHAEKMTLKLGYEKVLHEKKLLQTAHDLINKKYEANKIAFSNMEKQQEEQIRNGAMWQGQCAVLQKKYDEQMQLFNEEEKHATLLAHDVIRLNKEIEQLKIDNKTLSEKNWQIAEEKAVLRGRLEERESVMV